MNQKVNKAREQLAEELADLCADALGKSGLPIDHGGRLWQALYSIFLAEIQLS